MRRAGPWLTLGCALAAVPFAVVAQGSGEIPKAPGPATTASGAPSLPPLVAEPGDPGNVDEVVLPARPALSLAGKGSWDDGMKAVQDAFGRIRAELAKLGIEPAGRPLAIFTETTDDAFQFQAVIPIAATPTPTPSAPGFTFTTTPSGKAYRFVHKGAYEEVDSTYETITAYLDAKDIVAKDAFIEEYLNDVSDPADTSLEVNIYVQAK